MRLITYMMQYLTSILFPPRRESKKSNVDEQRIKEIEKKIEVMESHIGELAFCIQQVAASIAGIAAQSTSSDSLDDFLKTAGSDDDGSGYLH